MRIAFVHDWFTVPAGAEKVAREIIDLIQPHAIFTLFNTMDPSDLEAITQGIPVHTSFLQRLPGIKKHYRWMAPLFPLAISRFDLSDYDLIISSSWMVAKGVRKSTGQQHHCYCHTPMRFAWGLEKTYLDQHGLGSGIPNVMARLMINRLRNWDQRSADNVDAFLSNSQFIQHRIQAAYQRPSTVVYPPVRTSEFGLCRQKQAYFFMATRLVDYKNVALVIEAFNRLPNHQLIIAGDGPLREKLKSMAAENIKFLGWISDAALQRYMQHARAFVNASVEDFGIAGVEAQATGTPVIAYAEGGYTETVIEGVTGTFFHRLHPEALADAVLRLDNMQLDAKVISMHAQQFDTGAFREQFLNHVLDKAIPHVEA